MIPERVTDELISWLRGSRLSPMMVVHVNHPAEIDEAVADGFGRLIDAGIPVLNQSVLLRGVNDRADVLTELCRRLVDLRVMPYYLHQLNPVAGAAHFEVPLATGIALMAKLRARLPGYAVPRYVRRRRAEPARVLGWCVRQLRAGYLQLNTLRPRGALPSPAALTDGAVDAQQDAGGEQHAAMVSQITAVCTFASMLMNISRLIK